MTDVIRYGDTLLVAVPTASNLAQVQELTDRLQLELPGVRVIAVSAAAFAVYRSEGDKT